MEHVQECRVFVVFNGPFSLNISHAGYRNGTSLVNGMRVKKGGKGAIQE